MSEAVVASLDGKPLRASFPMRATVFGIDVVVIPSAEHAALLRATGHGLLTSDPFKKSSSRIDNDRELAEFLVANLGRLHISEAVEECRRRFGEERTPSRSAIDRFRQRLRRQL